MRGYKYGEIDGVRNFSDSYIMSLWDKIVEEGKDKSINVISDKWERKDFLRSVRSGRFHLWIFFEGKRLIGLIWVTNLRPKRAELHFCTFNGFKDIIRYGKLAQATIIDYYGLDVLYGFTPSNNRTAIKYLYKLGWKELGILPKGSYVASEGKSIDSVIMYLEA